MNVEAHKAWAVVVADSWDGCHHGDRLLDLSATGA